MKNKLPLINKDFFKKKEQAELEQLTNYVNLLESLQYLLKQINNNKQDDVLKIATLMFLQTTQCLALSFDDDLREKIGIKKRAETSEKPIDQQDFSNYRLDLAHADDFLPLISDVANFIEYTYTASDLKNIRQEAIDLGASNDAMGASIFFQPSRAKNFDVKDFSSKAQDEIAKYLSREKQDPLVKFASALLTAKEILKQEEKSFTSQAAFCFVVQTAVEISKDINDQEYREVIEKIKNQRNIKTYEGSKKCGIAHAPDIIDLILSNRGVFSQTEKAVTDALAKIISDESHILDCISRKPSIKKIETAEENTSQKDEATKEEIKKARENRKLEEKKQKEKEKAVLEQAEKSNFEEMLNEINKHDSEEKQAETLKRFYLKNSAVVKNFLSKNQDKIRETVIKKFALETAKDLCKNSKTTENDIEELYLFNSNIHKEKSVMEAAITSGNSNMFLFLLKKLESNSSKLELLLDFDVNGNYFLEKILLLSHKLTNNKIVSYLQEQKIFQEAKLINKAKDLFFALLSKDHDTKAKELLKLIDPEGNNKHLKITLDSYSKSIIVNTENEETKKLAQKDIDFVIENITDVLSISFEYIQKIFSSDKDFVKQKINQKITSKKNPTLSDISEQLTLIYCYTATFGDSEGIEHPKPLSKEDYNELYGILFLYSFGDNNLAFLKFCEKSKYSENEKLLPNYFVHYFCLYAQFFITKSSIEKYENLIDYLVNFKTSEGLDLLSVAAISNNPVLFDYLVDNKEEKFQDDDKKITFIEKIIEASKDDIASLNFLANFLVTKEKDFGSLKFSKHDFLLNDVKLGRVLRDVNCFEKILASLVALPQYREPEYTQTEIKDFWDKMEYTFIKLIPLTNKDFWFKPQLRMILKETTINSFFGFVFTIFFSSKPNFFENILNELHKEDKLDWHECFYMDDSQKLNLYRIKSTFKIILSLHTQEKENPLSSLNLSENKLFDEIYEDAGKICTEDLQNRILQKSFMNKKQQEKLIKKLYKLFTNDNDFELSQQLPLKKILELIKKNNEFELLMKATYSLEIHDKKIDKNKLIDLLRETKDPVKKASMTERMKKLLERDDIYTSNFENYSSKTPQERIEDILNEVNETNVSEKTNDGNHSSEYPGEPEAKDLGTLGDQE